MFHYLQDIIEKGLENIEKSLVRNEYKLRIYAQYFLPSLRFHLTVNDVCSTHLHSLNSLTDRYIKKWAGLPHPGTLAFLHMPKGLNVKSISDLYEECHTNAYISSRVKGDDLVNHCLDSKLTRESEWTRKISQTVKSNNILEQVEEDLPNDASLHQKQTKAKDILREDSSELWHSHVKSLVVQGRFLDLLSLQERSFEWNSIVYNLPARVSKFLINSVSDTLNTRANLQRWGRSMNSNCKSCGNKETLHHVLNHCSQFLEQGRFTWRHDNILAYIHSHIKASISDTDILNCDLDGGKSGYTTVPLCCTATDLIPDLCLYSDRGSEKCLTVFELSVPFETNIDDTHSRKTNKYAPIVADIESKNIKTNFLAIEIGSRGFISDDNMKRLKLLFKHIDSKRISFKNFKNDLSKLSIVSSFVIYNSRNNPSWDSLPILSV